MAAGDDGLILAKRILAQAGDFLHEHGVLVVEVGNSADALEAAYPSIGFEWIAFERGGGGVFVLTAEELAYHAAVLQA